MRDWNGGGEEGLLTFSPPAATSSTNREKGGWRRVLTDMSSARGVAHTHLFNQGLMLVRLAEEAADLVCRDAAVLTPAHPALVLVLLREAVPEDLKSLPYGLLAHCSDQRSTQFI